jgi:hypothetical protein
VPRAEGVLERGEDSLEGLKPPSEAETHPRGRGPRTRRSSAQGVSCPRAERELLQCGARPSSETEVHSRVAGMVFRWATEAIGSWALFVMRSRLVWGVISWLRVNSFGKG